MRSFTHNHMATPLNLQRLIIYKISIKENCYKVKIANPGKSPPYPHRKTKKIKKNGFGKIRKIRHGIVVNGLPGQALKT
jgi:hypothetical protein